MSAEAAAERLGVEPGPRAGRRRGDPATGRVRAQRAGDRAAAEPLGGGPGAAVQPDEHHAADRRCGQSRDRPGGDGRGRAGAGDVQRRHGLEPGAEGASQRGGAGPAPGPARPGTAIRSGRGDRVDERSCPGTSCCSRRATSYRRTAGSSPPRRSRCRKPRSPARARR